MKVTFRRSFEKDIKIIKDKSLLRRVKELIETIEASDSLNEISSLKKLRGGGNFYRLRIGDYRIGLAVEGDAIVFVRFINRKDIYRFFP